MEEILKPILHRHRRFRTTASDRRRRRRCLFLDSLVSLVVMVSIVVTATMAQQTIPTVVPPPPPASTIPTLPSPTSSWCVARSDASDQAMQAALDYACSAGADCAPIQSSGLCYLPNTLIAHASYAFNSYYQRKSMAPGSCNFAGTATVAKTDPSYGSCVYPSSLSSAGGATTTNGTPGGTTANPGAGSTSTNPAMNPYLNTPPPPLSTGTTPFYGNGGLTPGIGGPGNVTPSQTSRAASHSSVSVSLILLLLVIPVVYQP
ncbi:OLC1v1019188C1 [Oldenlandia corymbosa var. corymbosa]|uniref:OLC1v1019188C1 n=1 Tax=Oldenlandia corymbosa var. corymbosa TaxID=529605 RepID=A0AAV1EDI5_OLDCO|nr:OLC1v1019188C1 [Oldenlandia corymbosa var. corymbosa]